MANRRIMDMPAMLLENAYKLAGADNNNEGRNLTIVELCKYGYLMKHYVIDATGLDENTYYPVTSQIPDDGATVRIEVLCALNNPPTPSWGADIHNRGFSCQFIEEVNGVGWGASNLNRRILESDYTLISPGEPNPIGNVGQMTNSSSEYIYVRGGGKYHFYVSHNMTPELQTDDYTHNLQTISPLPIAQVDFKSNAVNIVKESDWFSVIASTGGYLRGKMMDNGKSVLISGTIDNISGTGSSFMNVLLTNAPELKVGQSNFFAFARENGQGVIASALIEIGIPSTNSLDVIPRATLANAQIIIDHIFELA